MKVITLADHIKGSGNPKRQAELIGTHLVDTKRAKMCASELRLVLVFLLKGPKIGGSVLNSIR